MNLSHAKCKPLCKFENWILRWVWFLFWFLYNFFHSTWSLWVLAAINVRTSFKISFGVQREKYRLGFRVHHYKNHDWVELFIERERLGFLDILDEEHHDPQVGWEKKLRWEELCFLLRQLCYTPWILMIKRVNLDRCINGDKPCDVTGQQKVWLFIGLGSRQ
jgi:hypothetical protein